MALFFITTLCISIIGLTLLLGLKHWELANGRTMGGRLRHRIGNFFHVVLLWVESIIPTLIRIYGRRMLRRSLTHIHRAAAILVLRIEKFLERTLYALRHMTDVRRGMGEASAFLREVAEHKKKLARDSHVHARVRATHE